MRIRVINPVAITRVDWGPLLRDGYADSHDPTTELDFVFLDRGIESPEQHFWEDLQMTFLMQEIERVDESSTDGVLVFCAADPGVASAKERLRIPVVGLLETSVALACLLGRRFTWLSPLSCGDGFVFDRIRSTGHESRLASIRSIEVPVVQLHDDRALLDKTLREGRQALAEDRADTLIVGCTGMFGLASRLQEALCVPVIDAGAAGIRMCETLVKLHLAQSKRAYPTPRASMGRCL
jgi:allantoin racemase